MSKKRDPNPNPDAEHLRLLMRETGFFTVPEGGALPHRAEKIFGALEAFLNEEPDAQGMFRPNKRDRGY